MRRFRKTLIANRGEIAVRVIRTLREMGIEAVAVYSDADRGSQHVRMADEAAYIGPSPSADSYLRGERIIEAALKHGAEAIHPGYGFLSENAGFAEACAGAGLVFIGPGADAIRRMGSKTAARETALQAGVPVVPGSAALASAADAVQFGREHGYPLLLKAVAGGGGMGMRIVEREEGLPAAFREAASEAGRAFGNPTLYLEKLITRPRHIEIQLIGDRHGNMIHLGERECSIQRRHQKLLEECPSPLVARFPEMRRRMGEAAIRIATAAGYYNAGTIEFLVDPDGNYYFLEMNTRLQVEHPVTELVTGLDLVRLQVEVASGEPLPLAQDEVVWRGSAIECRIYAEDPDNQFFPSPGKITRLMRPGGPGIRVDGAVYAGWTVPIEYDPLLAKLAAWASTREHAIDRALRALREYDVAGIKTNIRFFQQVMEDSGFRAAALHTGFVEEFLARRPEVEAAPEYQQIAALAAVLETVHSAQAGLSGNGVASNWKTHGRAELLR